MPDQRDKPLSFSGTTDCPDCPDKPGGCGYPILSSVVSAFDIVTGDELPFGRRGELRVLSRARMKGYCKSPEATAEFFKTDEDGNAWGCTGDIGYVDEDGEVFVLGRATDCCRLNDGEIVFLFDVEKEILKNEAVQQCKVVDIETQEGVRLVAHIVFRSNVIDANAEIRAIHKLLSKALLAHMVPHLLQGKGGDAGPRERQARRRRPPRGQDGADQRRPAPMVGQRSDSKRP